MEISSKKPASTIVAKLPCLPLLPDEGSTIELYTNSNRVAVFCKGLCIFTYAVDDKFSRNYCLVQLHLSGNFKLKYLANLFRLNYQHCSKILNRFKEFGIDGLKEEIESRNYNRKIISEEVSELILKERQNGSSYEFIANQIRFVHKKKISARSICNWMTRHNQSITAEIVLHKQMEMELNQEVFDSTESNLWHRNIYAGSMILYSVLDRTSLFRSFEEFIREDFEKKRSSSGVRRVILTVFFLHALRFKSIEQSKHLVGKDFCQIIGGSFFAYSIFEVCN